MTKKELQQHIKIQKEFLKKAIHPQSITLHQNLLKLFQNKLFAKTKPTSKEKK